MKNVSKPRKPLLFISTMLAFVFSFSACVEDETIKKIKATYPVIGELEAADGYGKRQIRLYIIDSCEYIGHINAFNSDFLTHKGNCKFCRSRSSK